MDSPPTLSMWLPQSLSKEILSAWQPIFLGDDWGTVDIETQYLIAEFFLLCGIIAGTLPPTQEQCDYLFETSPEVVALFEELKDKVRRPGQFFPIFIPAFEKTLALLTGAGFRSLPFTFLGVFYEHFGVAMEGGNDPLRRNAMGAFYTPPDVARFIVEQTLQFRASVDSLENIHCLDPACGGGTFLVLLADALLQRELEDSSRSIEEFATCIQHILEDQVWGLDLLPGANRVSTLLLALWAIHQIPEFDLTEVLRWISHCTLGDFLEEGEKFQNQLEIIVGNP
ncbi:MAG TPA: N-6 DNA methylase, partial [Candidatus Lokiarchaeia archaeon]|nr:N-6 DNA methylase [Candidatus Lokiarchaeia archaeon]